jgi:HTH-type transcriptional regulator/antitoxin HigA
MNVKQKDLIGIIGEKGKVSEVLNRKRKLSLNMIRKINKHLNLSPEILIKDYKLTP